MSFVKEIAIGRRSKLSSEELKKANDLCEKARKEDSKMVHGVFKNIEAPGGDVEFVYRKHKGEPIMVYHMKDGEAYDVPIGVAKHINLNTRVPIHSHLSDSQGRPMVAPGKFRERYQFLSTEYM
jgi:hypothetical protein